MISDVIYRDLDRTCWRCQTDRNLIPDPDRLLCVPCRQAVFGHPVYIATQGLCMPSYRYDSRWGSYPLKFCWRCMQNETREEDELGLCSECKAVLADASV